MYQEEFPISFVDQKNPWLIIENCERRARTPLVQSRKGWIWRVHKGLYNITAKHYFFRSRAIVNYKKTSYNFPIENDSTTNNPASIKKNSKKSSTPFELEANIARHVREVQGCISGHWLSLRLKIRPLVISGNEDMC